MPPIRRIRVPAFPQSTGPFGARNPRKPTPWTRASSPFDSTCTPRARKAFAVDSRSPDHPTPRISLTPSAIAPKSKARWEMDFVPGTATSPTSAAAGAMRMSADDFAHQRRERADLVGEVREIARRDLLRGVAERVLWLGVHLD